jgi:protein arginine kinase
MIRKSRSHSALYQNKPWANNDNNIWLASTISLLRNLDKFPFPSRLEGEKRAQIVSLVSRSILQSPHLEEPFLIKSEDAGPVEKEYLVEHFLSSSSFQQAHGGEAFILDNSGKFLTTINVDNHVHFELIDCKGELESAWNRMIKIETALGQEVNYAFSRKFGFLTTHPIHCGTGFVLTVYLQPSAILHLGLWDETLSKINQDGIQITGLQGDPNEIIGDILAVKNSYTLGLTEENIISTLRLFVTKLMVEENNLRSHLKQKPNPNLMDKVSRAYAVLMHSYQMETIEALDSLSLLKLGAALDWLSGVTSHELNRLFFDCRRAHLLARFNQDVPQEEIAHRRAEFIHETLKKVKLEI